MSVEGNGPTCHWAGIIATGNDIRQWLEESQQERLRKQAALAEQRRKSALADAKARLIINLIVGFCSLLILYSNWNKPHGMYAQGWWFAHEMIINSMHRR